MGYNMVINIKKKSDETSADDTNKTTPRRRQLRSRLGRQNSTGLQNGVDMLIEEEEDDNDNDDDNDSDENNEDEDDDDDDDDSDDSDDDDDVDEEENEQEDDDDDDGEDDKDDEYEEDFVDAKTEGSEDSEDNQATYVPSALNSDDDESHLSSQYSSGEEEGSGNEDEALSLVEELENLGMTPDDSNK
jgi:hypothetical protein